MSAATRFLTADSTEPEWPAADVVIGNPPFLGTKLQIRQLGEDSVGNGWYARSLRRVTYDD